MDIKNPKKKVFSIIGVVLTAVIIFATSPFWLQLLKTSGWQDHLPLMIIPIAVAALAAHLVISIGKSRCKYEKKLKRDTKLFWKNLDRIISAMGLGVVLIAFASIYSANAHGPLNFKSEMRDFAKWEILWSTEIFINRHCSGINFSANGVETPCGLVQEIHASVPSPKSFLYETYIQRAEKLKAQFTLDSYINLVNDLKAYKQWDEQLRNSQKPPEQNWMWPLVLTIFAALAVSIAVLRFLKAKGEALIEVAAAKKNAAAIVTKSRARKRQRRRSSIKFPTQEQTYKNSANQPTDLLEAQHGERLDSRAAGAAGGNDSDLEAMGVVNGAADKRGEAVQ